MHTCSAHVSSKHSDILIIKYFEILVYVFFVVLQRD